MNIVQDILKKDIFKSGDRVAVALSGGADSLALLMILLDLKNQLDIEVLAFHVNHSIRDESDIEQKYVKKLLNKLKVEAYFFTIDKHKYKKSGKSIEETARKYRYDFFDKKADELSCLVALGHHLEDQSETVFFHILRGTGLTGLTGMKVKSGKYIRPLLNYTKKDLIDYLEEHKIDYLTDESNFDTIYTRNKIREQVIPYIDKELGVDLNKKLYDMSQIIRDDEEFLIDFVEDKYKNLVSFEDGVVKLDLRGFNKLSIAIKRRLIRKCISVIYPSLKDISFNNIQDVISLSSSENGRLSLVNGIVVKKVYDSFVFLINENKSATLNEYSINKNDIVQKMNIDKKFVLKVISAEDFYKKYDKIPNMTFKKFFDYDKFKGTIFIRSRKLRDFISIKGGKKSIKKIFIDDKIPADLRDSIYLVGSNDSDVAWIVGYRIGEEYKVSNRSKKILEVEFIGEENE